MKLLSIDVGIKNLSFCLFEKKEGEENFHVLKWDNIDLSEKNDYKCIEIDKKGVCSKPAKYIKDTSCYCLKHSKKYAFLKPTPELKSSFLNKQKLNSLIEIAQKYNIIVADSKKPELVKKVLEYIEENSFKEIEKSNAAKVNLVTISKNILYKFDILLEEHLTSIDRVIIENQIGPLANKMKTIQGMLVQYFVMKNSSINIDFINASNKLKGIGNLKCVETIENINKIDYKQRKKISILACLEIINTNCNLQVWQDFVKTHTKKDDLCDSFLQGLWYLKNKS